MIKNTVLLIDPQNDFCDIPGAALPVPGSDADMHRAARFIENAESTLRDIVITLDTQPTVAIERTSFWQQGSGTGAPVAPFTQITEQSVRNGQFTPRAKERLPEVLTYLHALEAGGRYKLMVWPIHCVLGTWGHNIHSAVQERISLWEQARQQSAHKVLKGQNPMTEQYSALRAEVPLPSDPLTQMNHTLVDRLRPHSGRLFVAGEASSHCVCATLEHLLAELTPEEASRVVILRDCMSPVQGFAADAERFFKWAEARGAHITTSTQALTSLS